MLTVATGLCTEKKLVNRTPVNSTQTQTQVYLKAVAEMLKKIQCSARTNNFKNTIKRMQYKLYSK